MRFTRSVFTGICAIAIALTLMSCEREQRQFRTAPPANESLPTTRMSALQAGSASSVLLGKYPYEGNAYAISEGKRLYAWFNCVGCHFHGGGGIGPPLMDHEWIYGGTPENIFASIVEGRPNGMPSFGGKIPTDQVWQLVAYVRSLSGLQPKAAVPVRSDHMHAKPPE